MQRPGDGLLDKPRFPPAQAPDLPVPAADQLAIRPRAVIEPNVYHPLQRAQDGLNAQQFPDTRQAQIRKPGPALGLTGRRRGLWFAGAATGALPSTWKVPPRVSPSKR